MNDPIYKIVLFNVDQPEKAAKKLDVQALLFENIKNSWVKELQFGTTVYIINALRPFDEISEIFGATHYLIVDVKKK